ncbi:MAG TPA: adenylate kinase [Candidatus Krumholzibacteria bacterium]|nr:adenylate kinase [Candidatus Krumholzibacteria bacterium]
MRNVVLMGPPGSGKGTQAARLAANHALRHVSTGEILRRAVRDGTELGKQVESILQDGGLVSDDLILDLMKETLTRLQSEGRGWLLDGFPRTAPQAEGLVEMLTAQGIEAPVVVSIVVPEEEIVQRLSGRLTCTADNHVVAKGDAEDGDPCPECGAPLYIRADDKPETVRNRLRVYHEKTAACTDVLGTACRVVAVDGLGAPRAVTERIEGVLASDD